MSAPADKARAIAERVANYYGIDPERMAARESGVYITRIRAVAMYLAASLYRVSTYQLARTFDRHEAAVRNNLKKFRENSAILAEANAVREAIGV